MIQNDENDFQIGQLEVYVLGVMTQSIGGYPI